MGRPRADLEQLMATWARIAEGQIVEDTVSYQAAVRILIDRLAQIVRPGQAIQPYVQAMITQGYRRATAYQVVRAAFAIAAERIVHEGSKPKTVRTAPAPDHHPGMAAVSVAAVPAPPEPALKSTARPPVPWTFPTEATPAERGAAHRQECAGRPLLRADPAYYGVYGQAAFGALPRRGPGIADRVRRLLSQGARRVMAGWPRGTDGVGAGPRDLTAGRCPGRVSDGFSQQLWQYLWNVGGSRSGQRIRVPSPGRRTPSG